MKTLQMTILLIGLLSTSVNGQYKLYKDGIDAYNAGKYEDAIALLSNFLQKHRRQKSFDQDAYYVRGLSFYKIEGYEQAVSDFEASIRLEHPNRGNIHWFIAKCYSAEGFHPKAVQEYSEAMKILTQPADQVALLLERSKEYRKMDDRQRAVGDLDKGLALQPRNAALMEELGSYEGAPTGAPEVVGPARADLAKLKELYKGERRFALVIGNSTYKNVPPLRNPVNDAAAISSMLQKLDFEVIDAMDATYMEIRSAFFKFHEKLVDGPKGQTVGLFFYAGHGLQSDGENYMVPVDANIEYEDDIARQCFPVQKIVLSNMERSNSRMNIVVLDACRNNPFPAASRTVGDGLTEMKKAKGSFIAYATAPGSTASDGVSRNGLYTQELLKAMAIPGLSLEQVFKEVRANVLRLSGDKQNTWDVSNITGDFHFNLN